MVQFNVFPNNRRRPLNPTVAQLDEEIRRVKVAQAAGLIAGPFDMVVLANGRQYETEYALGPARLVSDGMVKTWWGNIAMELVMPYHNADGSWATEVNDDSVDSLQYTHRDVIEFYRRRQKEFPYVPKLGPVRYSAEEIQRSQFGNGPAMPFPFARVVRLGDQPGNFSTTWPKNIAMRINGEDLEFFDHVKWEAENPLNATPTPAPPSNDNVLIMKYGIARMTLLNPALSDTEKVASLKQLYGV